MKKRLIALFLCSALIFGMIPTITRAADDGKVKITSNGQTVSKVYVPMNDPAGVTVTAVLPEGVHQGSGQWEIYISSMDKWVNIQGATGMSLNLRFALMYNAMDGSGVAKVRYTFTDVNSGKEMEPAYLTAILTQDSETTMLDEREHQEIKPIVTDPGHVDVHYLIEPEEKTEDKTEEKSEEKTEEKTEDKTEEKSEEKIEDKTEEKSEENTEDKPAEGQTSGETSNEGVTPDENTDGNQNAAENQNLNENPGQNEDPAQELDENLDTQNVDTDEADSTEESQETENVSLLSFLGLDSWVLEVSADETPDVKKTYNIVINYKFENNEIVSDPYTANLAEGSSFSATVTFPTVQGYLPYVNDVQQNGIELNYASISEDVTINVVYKPTNVNYTVIHYQQNVENDQYTEVARETKQGLTVSQVPEVHKSYEGFYNLLYERPAIAADGSTVIEVYYDRYYYLMNFDMDGGYGTEPVYARYGAPVGTVTNPTKKGYTFQGWSLTKPTGNVGEVITTVTLPTTMPAESKNYYAVWTGDDKVAMTVVIWGENADDDDYTYMESKVILVDPNTGFSYDQTGDVVCGIEEHTHTEYTGSCYELTCTTPVHTHTDACLNCNHTHTTNCYKAGGIVGNDRGLAEKTKPTQDLTHIGNGIYTYTTTSGMAGNRKTTHYYVNIGDKWYCSKGALGNGEDDTNEITFNCTHTHNDECYGCGQTAHTHDASCYTLTCTKTEHTHSATCSTALPDMDSSLWVLNTVKSEKTDSAEYDGSTVVNVYYDRKEFTLTFQARTSSGGGNSYSTVATIKAKWGADISGEFDKAPFNTTYDGRAWECTETSKYSYALQTLERMPKFDATFRLYDKSSNTLKTIYYYVEKVGANVSDNTWPTSTTNFDLLKEVNTYFNFATYDEEYHEIEGFTRYSKTVSGFNNNEKQFSNNELNLYYLRNSYNLVFNNGENNIKTVSVEYQANLGQYNFTPNEVPSKYEPGSVKFDGWYLNPECTGEQYILANHTMPAGAENGDNALVLYAKWVPVTRTVKFFLTENHKEVYTPSDAEQASFTVPHASTLDEEYVKNHLEKSAMNKAKPNGDYTFVMWYYYENGEKKPFDPTTQIRKDLTLYGEWSSNTLKEYTVQYVLKSDHSVKVADDLTGSGLAGTTKTFDAKGGTDLYAAYQEGYFPTVQSQSLLLDIESDSLVITFEYVPMPAVPYTVKYVEKDTGESLAENKYVEGNRKAVVTETFKPISGYMPDAYQKRLVVTADGENILYFYYTKDDVHAMYIVKHFTQNTDGATWSEYATSSAQGDIGTRYTASPITIPGYTYQETKYVVSGTEVTDVTAEGAQLTENGLEINLYYVRNEYPYQVRYLEQGSGNELHDPKNGTGRYGEIVSESAIDIDGYDKVNPTSVALNIRIDEGEGAPNINIITFYYKEQEVTINYVAVGPEGATNFGSVTPTTETVKVKSGTAQGSTPTAGDGFKFVGWFKDATCTEAVDASWVTDNKITPQKTDGKNVAATYYAKFEYDITSLTIEKKIDGTPYDQDEVFIFTVSGEGINQRVVVPANGSVTINGLKVGAQYTITEDTSWSWRYEAISTNNPITLEATAKNNVVVFTNKLNKNKWLDDNAYAKNVFTK